MSKVQHDSETLAENQQVITACAFIHRLSNNIRQVFLPKRAVTKKFLPRVHELPGGHMDFGENPKKGLQREILEEFQVKIKVGDPFYTFTYLNEIKKSHSIEVVFFATFIDPIEKIQLAPEDHSEYGWFSENELDKIMDNNKNNEDPEIKAIIKGFQLLKGKSLDFGE